MKTHYQITAHPIDLDALHRAVADPAAGALAWFLGVTRNSFQGRVVAHLEYEAYSPMAEREMARIGTEIAARWPSITGIAIAHRVGRVEIGATSVAVVVSAPHRHEALAACAHGIERLKAGLPVWKKEVFTDGSVWRENEAPSDGR